MTALTTRIDEYLHALTAFADRHMGGEGNRAATALFAATMRELGYDVRVTEMACIEWVRGDARLEAGELRLAVLGGPYSLPCDVTAPLVPVATVEELERDEVRGAIVLLHGEIASGMYMPRNFRFYNPESHRRVYGALDTFAPAAVVAATGCNPEMVGAQYPFPLFADGDLDVPNAYLRDVDAEPLLALAGGPVRLVIDSERRAAVAEHVVAQRPGSGAGRVLLTAHIDSWHGSPGALDNASGVATLLAAAELLRDYQGSLGLEFVPFNGEDDYSTAGELHWLAENEGRMDDVALNINMDDSGQRGSGNSVSFYGCPPNVEEAARTAMARYPGIEEGPQWFQGDHAILSQQERPALAIGSSEMVAFMARYAHTAGDTLDLADSALIATTARFVSDLVRLLAEEVGSL